jgi:hypothetical protein
MVVDIKPCLKARSMSDELEDQIDNFSEFLKLFRLRNKYVHGSILKLSVRIKLRSIFSNTPEIDVTPGDLYDLANELWKLRSSIYWPEGNFRFNRVKKIYFQSINKA